MAMDKYTRLRELIVVISPLTLGLLEIWHPVGSPNKTAFEALSPQVDWWITIHLLQVPLFGLVALSVILLVNNLRGWAATISRIGIGCFIVFYPTLDSITGIAGGLLIRSAQELPPKLHPLVAKQVNLLFFDPIVGGSTFSLFGVLGALSWLVGLVAAAIALSRVGVSRLPVILLVLSGIFFAISHVPPTGPLGMGCLFIAAVMIDFPVENKNKFGIKQLRKEDF